MLVSTCAIDDKKIAESIVIINENMCGLYISGARFFTFIKKALFFLHSFFTDLKLRNLFIIKSLQ